MTMPQFADQCIRPREAPMTGAERGHIVSFATNMWTFTSPEESFGVNCAAIAEGILRPQPGASTRRTRVLLMLWGACW